MKKEFLFRIRVVFKGKSRTTTAFYHCIAESKQQAIKYAEEKIDTIEPIKGMVVSMFTTRKKVTTKDNGR
jgi:hypothetical protein